MYTPSPHPYNPNINELLDYVLRELSKLEEDSVGTWDLPITTVAPSKPRTGMIRYADGTAWNPGPGAGVYVYTGSSWSKL